MARHAGRPTDIHNAEKENNNNNPGTQNRNDRYREATRVYFLYPISQAAIVIQLAVEDEPRSHCPERGKGSVWHFK
jgi:hypothetical protein